MDLLDYIGGVKPNVEELERSASLNGYGYIMLAMARRKHSVEVLHVQAPEQSDR